MKKIMITISLLTVLLLSGCSNKSDDFLEQFPQTLRMETAVPENYPNEVTSYAVDWFAVNENIAVKTLFQSDSPHRTEYAEGPQYSYSFGDTEEVLNIYSGVVKGGIHYQLYTNGLKNDWLSELEGCMRTARPWEDATSSSYTNMKEYPYDTDLDFLDRTSALSRAETILTECGITDVKVEYTESRSIDLMNYNREQYNAKTEGQNPELIWSEPFTKAQENYYFEFRRTLDDIPFANCNWPRTSWNTATNTQISVIIGADGLLQLRMDGLFRVDDILYSDKIISPQDALQVYLDEYSKAIHFTNTEILRIELNYVVVMDNQGMYAKPAWLLTTATERKADEYENAEDDFTEYDTIAVSAYSGAILERETDTR